MAAVGARAGIANPPEDHLDNLTHAMVGAAIGRAGAHRTTPLATATLVLAANAPDVDMLSYTRGGYFALAFRRGITHGLPAMAVLPFVVAGIMLGWDRWVRRRRDPEAEPARAGPILFWSCVGLLTHPALDWMNTYGMRWWLPFDGAWSYGDALFIIDPWLWLGLGGAVFLSVEVGRYGRVGWPLLALVTTGLILVAPVAVAAKVVWCLGLAGVALLRRRRAAVEPASAGGPPGRLGDAVARGAVGAAALYILAMVGADVLARGHVVEAARAQGLEVEDVMVAPLPANPFAAEVEILTPDGYVPGRHRWLATPRVALRPEEAVPLLTGPADLHPDDLLAIAGRTRAHPVVADYLVWSRYPWLRVEGPEGEGWRVRVGDARYDDEPRAGGLGGLRVWVEDAP